VCKDSKRTSSSSHTGFACAPRRWARVHGTPCTPYCYATASVYCIMIKAWDPRLVRLCGQQRRLPQCRRPFSVGAERFVEPVGGLAASLPGAGTPPFPQEQPSGSSGRVSATVRPSVRSSVQCPPGFRRRAIINLRS